MFGTHVWVSGELGGAAWQLSAVDADYLASLQAQGVNVDTAAQLDFIVACGGDISEDPDFVVSMASAPHGFADAGVCRW